MSIYRSGKSTLSKKKSTFEKLEPEDRLRIVLAEFENPMKAVMDIIYPDHESIVGSDIREPIKKPQRNTDGLFRVIYSKPKRDGSRPKIKSMIIKAINGYDAKLNFDIDKTLDASIGDASVIGVECIYVPRKLKNEFLREFNMENQSGVVTPLVEQAWATLIEELEIFEDEKPAPDLTNFINDE